MSKKILTGILGILLGVGLSVTARAHFLGADGNMAPGEEFVLPCPGPGPCGEVGPGPGKNHKPGHHKCKGENCPPPEIKGQGPGAMGRGPGMEGPGMGMGPSMEMRRRYMSRMWEQDPQRYKRMLKIRDLSRDYRRTDNQAKKDKIEKELRPLLEQELKAQQSDAKVRVIDMEKKLGDLKKVLKQRDEHWNEVVDFNFKKITGQADYLEFPSPPQGAPEPPPSPREPQK